MGRKTILAGSSLVVAAALLLAARFVLEFAEMGSGFVAKTLCSGVFVSGRPEASVINEDVRAGNGYVVRFFSADVHHDLQIVTASLLGFGRRLAWHDPGHGCSLASRAGRDVTATGLRSAATRLESDQAWPDGSRVDNPSSSEELDRSKLDAAIDLAFADRRDGQKRTRAVVVVHHGRIVAERYSDGIGITTPQLGWSLAKVVTNALAGVAVRQGRLSLYDRALLAEWRGANDPRGEISVGDLLQMRSGLAFHEDYASPISDVRRMLFIEESAAGFAASKSAAFAPGTHWQNSGGDANILSWVIRQRYDPTEYRDLPQRELFGPLGMTTAVMERDPSGTYVGSSFVYASARDWARLGLLYLRDGVWNGRQILPRGWVRFSVTPTRVSGGEFGADIWRHLPGTEAESSGLPADAFFMLGFDGQLIAVVPSRDLVVVRLGLSRPQEAFQPSELLATVLAAFTGSAQ